MTEPKLELSYTTLNTEDATRYLESAEEGNVQLHVGKPLTYQFFESPAKNARDIIATILEKAEVLPEESVTTIDLMYGRSSIEIHPLEAKRKVELLKEEINFLSELKEGDLIQNPETHMHPLFNDLEKRGFTKEHYLKHNTSGGYYSDIFIRVLRTDTSILDSEMTKLQGEIETQKNQSKKLFEALEKVPKTDVYVLDTKYRDYYDRTEGGTKEFRIFNIPKPVAYWLRQIWMSKKSGTRVEENEKISLSKIEYLIKDKWKPTHSESDTKSTFSMVDFTKDTIEEHLIEDFVLNNKKRGVLFGIEIKSDKADHHHNYQIGQLSLSKVRKNIEQKIKNEMEKLEANRRKL